MKPTVLVKKIFYFICFLLICNLHACDSLGISEQLISFENQTWPAAQKPLFQIEVADSNASYLIYFVIRHSESYPYKNIWVSYGHQFPGEQKQSFQNKNLALSDDATGWYGAAMDDVIEQRILLTPNPIKIEPGTCSFQIEHLMRMELLPQVLQVGIRLERVVQ